MIIDAVFEEEKTEIDATFGEVTIIEHGGSNIRIDSELSEKSTNPV